MLKPQKRNEGFTIIEVLIVLAIAGLILVIVFLAVPNLQRNARNTSRKDEASRIAGAASNFVSNNNGSMPSTAADALTILKDAGTIKQYSLSTTTGATTPTAGQLAIVAGPTSGTATLTAAQTVDNVVAIYTKAMCTQGTAGSVSPGSNRQMAMLYTVETTSSFQAVCQDI